MQYFITFVYYSFALNLAINLSASSCIHFSNLKYLHYYNQYTKFQEFLREKENKDYFTPILFEFQCPSGLFLNRYVSNSGIWFL